MQYKKQLKTIVLTFLLALLLTLPVLAANYQISGNGTGGIYIDLNASPYSDSWDPRWGNPYGTGGCTWFAEARTEQLTGINCAGIIYGVDQWYNTVYSRFGFTRSSSLDRNHKCLVCWSSPHIAVFEGFDSSGKLVISEGGVTYLSASNGYAQITTVDSEAALKNRNSGFMGYIVLPVASTGGTGKLDLNGLLDGTSAGSIANYGTCDVYINGKLAADDCGDYCTDHPQGTTYSIQDIKAKDGYSYEGVSSGSLSGTITSGSTIDVRLKFNSCKLDVKGMLDDKTSDSLGAYGSFDVYINGSRVADDVNDFNQRATKGASYEITDIKSTEGHEYAGVISGNLTGNIGSGTKTVVLGFNTVGTATGEWTYSEILPKNITADYCDIEYQYTSTKVASSSPGTGWVKKEGSATTKYENSGSVYDSDFELSTSNTRVYVGFYYYHYCGASTGNNVEHYNDGSHTDYHVVGDVNNFYVSGGPWADDADSRYLVYEIKWKSGQWADGLATCAAGRSAIWYRRYQYQNKVAVTYYTWEKTTDWLSTPDPSLTPSRYRYRLKDNEDPVISFVRITEVAADSFTIVCKASDDTGIMEVEAETYTDSSTVEDAQYVEAVPEQADKEVEVSLTIPISDHGNERDITYHTRIYVKDKAFNRANSQVLDVYIPTLLRSPRKLHLPADLKEIESGAFEGSIAFGEVILPDNAEKIGDRAFADCSRLVLINIPDSVTDIGEDVFDNSPNVVIYCSIDSAAAAYAQAEGIPYLTKILDF